MFHILLPEDATKAALIAAGYISLRADISPESIQAALQGHMERFICDTRVTKASDEERLRAIMRQDSRGF